MIRSPWRNRLARSAVNRKVGGSSPPGDEFFSGLWFHCGEQRCICIGEPITGSFFHSL